MSPFTLAALGAAALVGVCWLVVSFSRPSPRRAGVEWLATVGLYAALGSFFVGRSLEAHADGSLLVVPFGFLAVLFCVGFLVSLYHLASHLLGRTGPEASATH